MTAYPHIEVPYEVLAVTLFPCPQEFQGLTKIPTSDRIYVKRLPYCIANGCQNSSPQPANKNIYPVPSFRVDTETPVASDS